MNIHTKYLRYDGNDMTDKVGIAVGETPRVEDASGMSSSYWYRVSESNVFGCNDS